MRVILLYGSYFLLDEKDLNLKKAVCEAICMHANEEDASDVFGISASHTDIEGGKLDYDAYIDVSRQLTEKFGFKKVAITLRGIMS